ncbi:MAG: pyruvate kinase [Thermoplasmata archaeon M9B1D]|nr:MAG: pyruvate kinase [Thermoplasmata archaeon M9B1D]PNX52160.1 MAG: pyruvate kinase [Thermoplasmata archaeon M8B2D]
MSSLKKVKIPFHKTKIVCTIGPASNSLSTIENMIKNGMSVARLNFSHGSLSEHKKNINMIQSVSNKLNQIITILIDLPGSKIRVGKLQSEPITLNKGDQVTLTTKDVLGKPTLIPINYKKLTENISKGNKIYINDGLVELKAEDVTADEVRCKVITGGIVLSHKGVNIPGVNLLLESVTYKDIKIVDFGLKHGVDTFGLSFIQNAKDILKIRNFARKKGKSVFIIAKIERREAIKNFDEILKVVDGVMVARGDLGLEIPLQEVPIVQKKLIRKANLASRPVITATQMLESMTDNTRPTRAEVTDVANAILDGADAVMLSEETAIGKYPVETVKMMTKISAYIERNRDVEGFAYNLRYYLKNKVSSEHINIADVISLNVVEATEALKIKYILTPTESGNTARRISRFKPDCWILAFSRNKNTCSFLPFSYGVYPFFIKNKTAGWHDFILNFIKNVLLVKKGDKVILTQRRFAKQKGGTDSLGIINID